MMRHLSIAALPVLLAWATVLAGQPVEQCDPSQAPCLPGMRTIAFTSTMAMPGALTPVAQFAAAEIYLMNDDGTNLRRLTSNTAADGFATMSPDGLGRIVFDSNRLRTTTEPLNTSFLFLMKSDFSEGERFLVRGGSPSWAPNGRFIAYHASASGTGLPIKNDPGAATSDSDIFIASVDDLLDGIASPFNVTLNPLTVDDDPDWSPDGQTLAFTSHGIDEPHGDSVTAEIHTIRTDGTSLARLTWNNEEERAAAWSPDGTRLAFMCRRGGTDFEICVMNADGTDQKQLTNNAVGDLSPRWSPDGSVIIFHRPIAANRFQLFTINPQDIDQAGDQLTNFPGTNAFADWGVLKIGIR